MVILISASQIRKVKYLDTGMRSWPHVQAVVGGHKAVTAAESYPVEKTSRVMPGCLFIIMAAFCVGSLFFLRMVLRSWA
ncbi:hypothetical protein GCM10010306_022010 [Streptomyces umbrinus]|uniref:hypothetical protein n=1 Tax=Streptomyces umbrinus TaxID=67370 RepID=UPI0016797681|nr:hypothetical protein [Streptomyces umbrinus]GHB29087.1 hypothetical protein GCM10010306_022010 [Streptomyces umbrinus]